jgi:hypothetical protein
MEPILVGMHYLLGLTLAMVVVPVRQLEFAQCSSLPKDCADAITTRGLDDIPPLVDPRRLLLGPLYSRGAPQQHKPQTDALLKR